MCINRYYCEGHRSFGDNIPGYAQGAYFPGDEPGHRCRLTGDYCGNPDGDTPTECAANEETPYCCPLCLEEAETENKLWKTGDGRYFCPECDGEWTEEELVSAYIELYASVHLADCGVQTDPIFLAPSFTEAVSIIHKQMMAYYRDALKRPWMVSTAHRYFALARKWAITNGRPALERALKNIDALLPDGSWEAA